MELPVKVTRTTKTAATTTTRKSELMVCAFVCAAVDACEQANGGCSELAVCKRTQPGRRECVCGSGYHGDGLVCVGTCPSILLLPVPSSYQIPPPCCLLLHVNSPPNFLLLPVSFFSLFPPPNSSVLPSLSSFTEFFSLFLNPSSVLLPFFYFTRFPLPFYFPPFRVLSPVSSSS